MPTQPQDRRPAKKTTSRRSSATRTSPVGDGEDKYAPSSWGAGTSGETVEDLLCPSGQLALVRRPGVEGLLKAGILHQLDSLTALVQQNLDGKNASTEAALDDMMRDPEKLANMMRIIDKVVCYVVVKPEVQTTPDDITRRQDGVVYADMVDLEDKLFILNYAVGGTRDLERFRSEHTAGMGALADGQGPRKVAKRAAVRKR